MTSAWVALTYVLWFDAQFTEMVTVPHERHGSSNGLIAILVHVYTQPCIVLVCTGFAYLETRWSEGVMLNKKAIFDTRIRMPRFCDVFC